MTNYTWRTGPSGDWGTGADWTPTGPPNAATATAVIDAATKFTVRIISGENFSANQVTLDAASATLNLASGGELTLAGTDAAMVLNAGTFVLAGLLQGGTVEADGATVHLGGTLDGVTWLGPLTFGPGEDLTVVGGLTVKTAAGTSPGTIDMSAGGDTLLLTGGETLDNAILNFSGNGDYLTEATSGGTLTLGSGFTLDSSGTNNWIYNDVANSSIQSTLTNAGLINVSAGTLTDAYGDIVNNGTITLGGGTLGLSSLFETLTNTGSVTIGAGGELAVYRIAANTGVITVGSGGLLSVFDVASDSGLVALDNGGTFSVTIFSSSQPFIDNGLLEANDFSASGITIASGGTLIGASSVTGKVTDRGLVEANGANGVMQLHNGVVGTGVLQIDAGAALQLDSGDTAKVDFAGVGGALILEQAGAFSGTIDGFTIGDRIDLPKVAYDPSGTATMLGGNTLQVVENASTYDFKFDPAQSFTGGYFHLTPDGTAIIENTVPPYYAWTTAVSGDWGAAADWTPPGPPDDATANAVIDAIGNYTVTIGGSESFVANALTLAAAGATLSVAGTLTLNEIISDGLIDIVGGTVDLSHGTLNNAGIISIGTNGALDGELILNAVAANGGSITIAAGGTLDLLGAGTLSGDTVAGLGSVSSTGGLLLIGGSLNLGGGTLDVAATGPLSEFGVAGELANGTVDANAGAILLENGAILNDVTWLGTWTIFGTESVTGVTGGNAINVAGGSLTNDGTITGGAGVGRHVAGAGGFGIELTGATLINDGNIAGGAGGSGYVNYSWGGDGGAGGIGLGVTDGTVTNSGVIAGGNGGNGTHLGSGASGGAGISLDAGSSLLNTGLIAGGAAGYDPGLFGRYFAGGGAGAGVTNSTLTNDGAIFGGASGNGGVGGAGVNLTNGTLTNGDTIAGGYGEWSGGAGAVVVGSVLSNSGAISGGAGFYFGATGVDITNSMLTNDGTITGGNGGFGYGGIGVLFHGGGTLTDAGFIGGGNGGGVDAVAFGAAVSRLILDPGAAFSGAVAADAAYSNVLELASAASAGTLAGLGSQYVGFDQITIDAGSSWTLNGANTIASGATLTELSGATLIDSGTLVNDGAIVLDPSTMTVAGLTGTGLVTIDAGSTLEVQGTIAGGETLVFAGSGAYLHLDSPVSVAGSVTAFGFGETIDLKGIDPTTVSYADGMLSFSGGSFALSLAGTGPVIASASGDGAAITAPCFRAGTRILTPSGERPVEQLAVGDLVRTVLGEATAPIIWVGLRAVDCARHPKPRLVWPVRVAAGAFGPGMPHRDVWLSPDHSVFVEEVLIPVKYLINDSTISQVPVDSVTYHHIELAEHDVLLAEGLPAESYLDMKDGWNYADRAGPRRLSPDYTARMWEAFGCARLIVTGPELQAARLLVDPRAADTAQTDAVTKHAA